MPHIKKLLAAAALCGLHAAGSAAVVFNPVNSNTGIDNISLTVTAVPEPGTWAMLAAGFGVISALRHRRKAD